MMPRSAQVVVALAAAIAGTVALAPARADDVSDAEVLALSQKHCVPCHARNPTHPAFDKAPRNLILETLDQIKANAARIRQEVVEDLNMPLGNEKDMTDGECAALGRWIATLK
jgi:uncharacterized membrane protein